MLLIGSFLIGISPYGPFPWKRSKPVYFLFSKAGKIKTSLAGRVPYNKVLTNLEPYWQYWPSVDFCKDLAAISSLAALGPYWRDLYSPVRPSSSVGKRVILFFVAAFFPRCEQRACFFSFCWNGIYDKNYDNNVKCAVHSSFVAVIHRI